MKADLQPLQEETRLTQLYVQRPAPVIPMRPTTCFVLQANAAQQLPADALSTIAPSAMKRVGIGYGGLKSFAYCQSLQEFAAGAVSGDNTSDSLLQDLVAQRCNEISRGVHGLEQALKALATQSPAGAAPVAPDRLEYNSLAETPTDAIMQNSEQTICYLSRKRVGRQSEPLDDEELALAQRLLLQIQHVAVRLDHATLLERISKL